MVQNVLITAEDWRKEAKKLREEIKALRKEAPKEIDRILSKQGKELKKTVKASIRQGGGALTLLVAAACFCWNVSKKKENEEQLLTRGSILGSISVAALGALLLLL